MSSFQELSPAQQRRVYHSSLDNVSTVDGRELPYTYELRHIMSEGALHRRRAEVDVEAMIGLSESGWDKAPAISEPEKARLRVLYHPTFFSAAAVQDYDHIGNRNTGQGPTEHDVKSVELYLRDGLRMAGLERLNEWLHFPLTSEDSNNLAWNLMIRDGVNEAWLPRIASVGDKLAALSEQYADVPVLGITHGMPASPTTVGKRFSYMLDRLDEGFMSMRGLKLSGKFSGPVGNHNAMTEIDPDFNYERFAREFVEKMGFTYQDNSTQRNSHTQVSALFDSLKRMNSIGADIDLNIRHNVMMGWLYQDGNPSHVGSSVMPNKINPWFFEVGEGYSDQANDQIAGASSRLLKSVFERHLGDHPDERAYGEMLAKSIIGFGYIDDGLDTLRVSLDNTREDLQSHPEVLSEVVQLLGRVKGVNDIYMKIKAATRGQKITGEILKGIIKDSLPDDPDRERLLALEPAEYVGIAPEIARRTVARHRPIRREMERGLLDPAKAIDAVMFDFDQTLQAGDKEEVRARLGEINTRMGLGFSKDEIHEVAKKSDYREMRKQLVDANNQRNSDTQITEDQFQTTNNEVTGMFDNHFRLAEGAKALLEQLKASGRKIAIVTTRGDQSLRRILRMYEIEDLCDAIISRDDVNQRKPHPEPLAAALDKLGVDSKRAMYIGDKQTDDIPPGNRLGVKTVLITDEEFLKDGAVPDYQFPSLKTLATFFGR